MKLSKLSSLAAILCFWVQALQGQNSRWCHGFLITPGTLERVAYSKPFYLYNYQANAFPKAAYKFISIANFFNVGLGSNYYPRPHTRIGATLRTDIGALFLNEKITKNTNTYYRASADLSLNRSIYQKGYFRLAMGAGLAAQSGPLFRGFYRNVFGERALIDPDMQNLFPQAMAGYKLALTFQIYREMIEVAYIDYTHIWSQRSGPFDVYQIAHAQFQISGYYSFHSLKKKYDSIN